MYDTTFVQYVYHTFVTVLDIFVLCFSGLWPFIKRATLTSDLIFRIQHKTGLYVIVQFFQKDYHCHVYSWI
jgi:hypothetical protein